MTKDYSKTTSSLSGEAILRPMSPQELAAVPPLTKEVVSQALARGAKAIAAAEAGAMTPAVFPKVRMR